MNGVSAVDLRGLIARSVRMLNVAGVMHMSGHVALRAPEDAGVFWINSRKASRSTLTANDVIAVDLARGERIGAGDEPPSEFHIHRAIFTARPDVHAIVHTHPTYVVALSLAGIALAPVHVSGAFLPERVPVFDDPNLINTAERGAQLAAELGSSSTIVQRGHGIVVTAADVEAVVARTVAAEENARWQHLAASVGTPKAMQGEELARAAREWNVPSIMRKHWHYHEETARRLGALDGIDG